MPAFVPDGPEIPVRLLQLHEEGQVVFFCGAGISCPAGLPLFGELVEQLYNTLCPNPSDIQNSAISAERWDIAATLLEKEVGAPCVRQRIREILNDKKFTKQDCRTHRNILELAKSNDGKTKLVTTNYDRLFDIVVERKHLKVPKFIAPGLPYPRKSMDGIVYLHGLLNNDNRDPDNERLIVTSGDFGLAYLVERWASIFMSALLHCYSVCFVGYSLKDAILRYLTDAIAAERILGEHKNELFAFCDCEDNNKKAVVDKEWRSKGVTPILYSNSGRNHYLLHDTLEKWADQYREGSLGKQMVVSKYASSLPSGLDNSTEVESVLWALTDEKAAKQFASQDPVPPIEWLNVFSEDRLHHDDLSRFGVQPHDNKNNDLTFSLIRHPVSYTKSLPMGLVSGGNKECDLDGVMRELAKWLSRHLDDIELLLWVCKNGGQLHPYFSDTIRCQLGDIEKLEKQKKEKELAAICRNAPKAIPSPSMRKLWDVVLAGHASAFRQPVNSLDWPDMLKAGLFMTVRAEIIRAFSPRVLLGRRNDVKVFFGEQLGGVSELVDYLLTFPERNTENFIADVEQSDEWKRIFPEFLPDFVNALDLALDILCKLEVADEKNDTSEYKYKAIETSPQFRDHDPLCVLIRLVRDAWLAVLSSDPVSARRHAEDWWARPFLTFKRLALFAASKCKTISSKQIVEWLSSDDYWWLWTHGASQEVLAMMRILPQRCTKRQINGLISALFSNPPRALWPNVDDETFQNFTDTTAIERITALENGGAFFSQKTRSRVRTIERRLSEYRRIQKDIANYSFLATNTNLDSSIATSASVTEIIRWLKQQTDRTQSVSDGWRDLCKQEPRKVFQALKTVVDADKWSVFSDRWGLALQAWSDKNEVIALWDEVAQQILQAPDDFMKAEASALVWWINAAAQQINPSDVSFFELCKRILSLHDGNPEESEDFSSAINSSPGLIADAVLRLLHRSRQENDTELPPQISSILSELSNTNKIQYRAARMILASSANPLYRADLQWTRANLLPLFDWTESPSEAKVVWTGFLSSGQYYYPLINDITPSFLDTANHYQDFGTEIALRWVDFLTFVFIWDADSFTGKGLRVAVSKIDSTALSHAIATLSRLLKSADDKQQQFWIQRISPFLDAISTQLGQTLSDEVVLSLADLCIVAGSAFETACNKLLTRLRPVHYPGFLHKMSKTNVCKIFPDKALEFLCKLIDTNTRLLGTDLNSKLDAIRKAKPSLQNTRKYKNLVAIAQ